METGVVEPRIVEGRIQIVANPRPDQGRWGLGILPAGAEREQNLMTLFALLDGVERADALGAALSVLLDACDREPHVLAAILSAHVDKPGQRSGRAIDVLNRAIGAS